MADRVGSRPLWRLMVAATLAIGALAVGGSPVAAECTGSSPSFRDALSTADRIVVGDVVALHHWRVGRAATQPAVVESVHPPDPLRAAWTGPGGHPDPRSRGSAVCRRDRRARGRQDRRGVRCPGLHPADPGQRGGLDPGTPSGEGNETITEAGLFRRLGLPAPDTAIATPRAPEAAPSSEPALLAVAGLFGLIFGWRRSTPRVVTQASRRP